MRNQIPLQPLRIKYGINPGVSGIYSIPAAESKVGYIPLFRRATVAWFIQGDDAFFSAELASG